MAPGANISIPARILRGLLLPLLLVPVPAQDKARALELAERARHGEAGVVADLAALLDHDDWAVRWHAVRGIGLLRAEWLDERLAALLDDERVAPMAAYALGQLAASRCRPMASSSPCCTVMANSSSVSATRVSCAGASRRTNAARASSFAADGAAVATAGADRRVRVWSAADGAVLGDFVVARNVITLRHTGTALVGAFADGTTWRQELGAGR